MEHLVKGGLTKAYELGPGKVRQGGMPLPCRNEEVLTKWLSCCCRLPVCLSVRLSVRLSICLCVCLPAPIRLSVCLPVQVCAGILKRIDRKIEVENIEI